MGRRRTALLLHLGEPEVPNSQGFPLLTADEFWQLVEEATGRGRGRGRGSGRGTRTGAGEVKFTTLQYGGPIWAGGGGARSKADGQEEVPRGSAENGCCIWPRLRAAPVCDRYVCCSFADGENVLSRWRMPLDYKVADGPR
jgi:hypothetical protein